MRCEPTRLPVSRLDAGPENRSRWVHCLVLLLRERVGALDEEVRAGMDGRELIGELFPILHSLLCWVDVTEVCRLLVTETNCTKITENGLRMALRIPYDHWARWWRDVRRPLRLLTRVHRADPMRILFEAGYLGELRNLETRLSLGDMAQSRAALEGLREARAQLETRWFIYEPRTREAARVYIAPVLASIGRDWWDGFGEDRW